MSEKLLHAASTLMLGAKAADGVVTVNEWDAIALLHCLPDIEQVPWNEPDGSFTWTTQEKSDRTQTTDDLDAEWCRACLRAALDEIKRLRKALQWAADNSNDPIVVRHALEAWSQGMTIEQQPLRATSSRIDAADAIMRPTYCAAGLEDRDVQ